MSLKGLANRSCCAVHEWGSVLASPVTVRSAGAVQSAIAATMREATKPSGARRRTWRSPRSFAIGDLGNSRDTGEPEIFDPPASLGRDGQQSMAALGTHSGLSGRFMHDVIFRNRNSVFTLMSFVKHREHDWNVLHARQREVD